jgi:hypothetical protein
VLVAREDYDAVVCGLSLAALPALAGELRERSPAWAAAVQNVQTVRTQALQLRLTHTSAQLGFPVAGYPIVTWLYDRDSPPNVWGDFSELPPMEGWTAPRRRRSATSARRCPTTVTTPPSRSRTRPRPTRACAPARKS